MHCICLLKSGALGLFQCLLKNGALGLLQCLLKSGALGLLQSSAVTAAEEPVQARGEEEGA